MRLILNPGRPVSCRWNLVYISSEFFASKSFLFSFFACFFCMIILINLIKWYRWWNGDYDDLSSPQVHIYSSTGPCTPFETRSSWSKTHVCISTHILVQINMINHHLDHDDGTWSANMAKTIRQKTVRVITCRSIIESN